MPTSYTCKPWDLDPRLWAACLREAGRVMAAQGWWEKAGKFNEVRRRRALSLWRAKHQ